MEKVDIAKVKLDNIDDLVEKELESLKEEMDLEELSEEELNNLKDTIRNRIKRVQSITKEYEKKLELLDTQIDVLDKGFVRLVDFMGDDMSFVQAARVSTGTGFKGKEKDTELLRYLYRKDHGSPFEMCELKFHMKLPLFVVAQLIRHRISSTNSKSTRYSEMDDEFYVPDIDRMVRQGKFNKQGGSDELILTPTYTIEKIKLGQEQAYTDYTQALEHGLVREIARIGLPVSLYTEIYWKINTRSLFNFLKLRSDPHAQKEIQEYSNAVWAIAEMIFPEGMKAFYDYEFAAKKFSRMEMEMIYEILTEDNLKELKRLTKENRELSKLERKEFLKKLTNE